MADLTKQARPYAQAIFEYAKEHKQLSVWSEYLKNLAQVVNEPIMAKLLCDPKCSTSQLADICIATLKDPNNEIRNFIKLLAENKRLIALPDIARLFETFRAESDKILDVQVSSAIELNEDFRKKLIQIMSEKLNRNVVLHCAVKPDLIGGLLIRADDLVIDSSVRGQLERMRESLLV